MTDEHKDHALTLAGMPWSWDLEGGNLALFGLPSVAFWTVPSLQRLLGPLRGEVGDDLYRLLVAHYSSLGTEEDYHAMITELGSDFESGFAAWGRAVSTAGWGRFGLSHYDQGAKEAVVRVENPWELQMQSEEEDWGCPFLQGKIIGIFSHALGVNCWAKERVTRTPGGCCVEFTVAPSQRTIEIELAALRLELMRAKDRALGEEIARKTEALREIEERQRAVLGSLGDLVFTADLDQTIIHYLLPRDQLDAFPDEAGAVGESILSVFGPSLPEVIRAQLAVPGATSRSVDFSAEASGRARHYDARSTVRRGSGGEVEGVTVMVRDVTRQRQLESQLRHSQKMESIGLLASGVAHDFNNILVGIMGAADLLALQVEGDAKELAETVLEGSETAAGLIQRLLDFSRKGQRIEVAVDVHAVIRDAVKLLKRTVDRRIDVVCQLDAEHAHVRGDAHQIQSAMLNLGVNSRDAMASGGELRFVTSCIELVEGGLPTTTGLLPAGHYLEIDVSDTGEGMPAETVARIFDPFFTTKAEGKGTGLGLAAVHGAISDHGGAIHVASEVGKGTIFKLFLPLRDELGLHLDQDIGGSEDAIYEGHGRVLLVDDEPIVRAVGEELLRKLGYDVLTADDGSTALEVYQEHGETVDLVILDMVMSKMNGQDAGRALRALDPSVRILFSSGFSRKGLIPRDALGFIKKPYRLAELGQAVARAFGRE